MSREEAIEYNKNLRMYMKLSDKNQPCKFLEENYIALDMAIEALQQYTCEDWYDVPSDEMTLEQARQAVKDLRKKLAEYLEQQSCEDTISRNTAIVQLSHNKNWDDDCDVIIQKDIETIKALPPVTLQQKVGKWIPLTVKDDDCDCWGRVDSHTEFKCSNCSKVSKIRSKYCPNCGEKKQEVRE